MEKITKEVPADTIVAENPIKIIKPIPPRSECSAQNEEDQAIQLGLDSCGD